MRLPLFRTALAFAFVLNSCSPQAPEPKSNDGIFRLTEPKRAEPHPGNTAPPPKPEEVIAPQDPKSPSTWPLKVTKTTVAGVAFTYLSFDTRKHTLAVFDQAKGLGSEVASAAGAARSTNALAAINGGFFTPEGKTLGLAYENGERIGSLNTASSLGSGTLYVDRKLAQPVIVRREEFQRWLQDSAFQPQQVLQSGPFLVENSRLVSGLSKSDARVRSLLLWDGKYHFALAQCEQIPLPTLARALAKQPLADFQITSALNLDGGRSADLYVGPKVRGGALTLRKWWNKPVRNYLVLLPQ